MYGKRLLLPSCEEVLIQEPFKKDSRKSKEFPQLLFNVLATRFTHKKKYPLFECPCFPVSPRVTLSGYPQNKVDGFARVGLKFLWGLQGAMRPSPGWLPIVIVTDQH